VGFFRFESSAAPADQRPDLGRFFAGLRHEVLHQGAGSGLKRGLGLPKLHTAMKTACQASGDLRRGPLVVSGGRPPDASQERRDAGMAYRRICDRLL